MTAAVTAVIVAGLASGCTSSSVSVAGPSGSKCQVNVTSSMQSAPPSGAAGTLTIGTSRDCTWAVSSTASWIVITAGSNGQGDGSAAYRIAANTQPSQRRGVIEVNSTQVAITQEAACRFDVSVSSTTVPAQGGTVTVNVQSGGTCGWTAASQTQWITLSAGSSGTGNGSVTLNVAGNGGAARTGNVLVAGETITLTQAQAPASPSAPTPTPPGPSCDPSLTPASQAFVAEGGTGTVSVVISEGCAWTAATGADWIALVSGASGRGPGKVQFNVAANAGAPTRQGVLTIAGRTFMVAQAGMSCGYAIAPTSASVVTAGGPGSVALATNTGCAWTAASNVNWIAITSAAAGTGSSAISFSVSANSGAGRTGTLTIGGQTFTVNQAPSCSYSIAPLAQAFPDPGGPGTVTVTADGGCSWTATSNANWIAISSGSSGSGNGTVTFSVSANAGAARSGSLTVAGQTFSVTQAAAACSYVLSAAGQSVGDAGGNGTVTVTTRTGCTWTAASTAAWITITAGGSGAGNGTVEFSVSTNTGAPRSGIITIAGQAFTVSQAAAPCRYSIAPVSQTFEVAGGAGTVAVTTGGACAWTATTSNADWLRITSHSSGTGNGTVDFAVVANVGPIRTGTLTIGGQPFTVTQGGS